MTTAANIDWNLVEVGQQLEPLADGPLTINDFVRYQAASGDMNPIHHDPDFATAAGFSGPFAVGMRQAGVLGTHLAETWGLTSVRELDLRFRNQAWPGDVLTYRTLVVGKREDDGQHLIDLELVVERQDGTPHITGTAVIALTQEVGR
ncbi:MaoC family dehydratase [Nocardioides sediminis]|uniref:MaoC family dehydratase n=1 Tax=Nocardioides sediminis TaxID=433648 RepID=UPI000D2F5BA0|nr:MaoC/PaaZ C-terminal domain-containing protein [Nocardioides sediminis]